MLSFLPDDIRDYAAAHSTPAGPIFQALADETAGSTQNPDMQVGPVQGTLLKILVRATGAKRVLEIGTFTGYSALMLAEGLADDGEVITCDINARHTKMATRYWEQHPAGRKIRLVLGAALETLERLDGPFDIVFIDADKENYTAYWEASAPKVRRGGLIVADNVLWSGRVLAPQERSDHALAAFNAHVRDDVRFDTVMLAVRDGITIACRR